MVTLVNGAAQRVTRAHRRLIVGTWGSSESPSMFKAIIPESNGIDHLIEDGWPQWLATLACDLYEAGDTPAMPDRPQKAPGASAEFALRLASAISDAYVDTERARRRFLAAIGPMHGLSYRQTSRVTALWDRWLDRYWYDPGALTTLTGAYIRWPESALAPELLCALAEAAWDSKLPPADLRPQPGAPTAKDARTELIEALRACAFAQAG